MADKIPFRRVKNWYLVRRHRERILASQWAGGAALVICAVLALILANLDLTREAYHHVLETQIGFGMRNFHFSMSVEQWVNDALMAIFFFVVGLEIKREFIAGELSSFRHASLPIAAAIGGMVVPALIYAGLNNGAPYEAGWGIPMATDIAFAIGILSLMGRRVPLSLKVFLMALAIVDDLGAILVIALFYSTGINLAMLGGALAILAILAVMNHRGVKSLPFYLIPGVVVWYLFLHSGVHATIAGVLLAVTIPVRPRFHKKYFTYKVGYFLEEFKMLDRPGVEVLSNEGQRDALSKVALIAESTISPAQRLEHGLTSWVSFFIMPVFALANAGVEVGHLSDFPIFSNTQGLGIFLGLVVGKPLGIMLLSWIMIRLRLAVMPEAATWGTMWGVACLGGIGFTMSIFIDHLAFAGTSYVDPGKIAVLFASLVAALLGILAIHLLAKKSKYPAK